MVNFLFISNHSRIQTVQRSLQDLLKVRIDIVGDFDCGLKEVFEKRPALVFIQEQIAGVTGESVARHIQMLLGAGGPSFVYLHDGNQKAKPVRGLYEHLVDLSQPHKKVMSDIQDSLKQLLGEQWQTIYLPPLQMFLPSRPHWRFRKSSARMPTNWSMTSSPTWGMPFQGPIRSFSPWKTFRCPNLHRRNLLSLSPHPRTNWRSCL